MRTKSVLLATVLGLLAVGVLLLLAACGGGGGDESAGGQATPAGQETQAPAEQETQVAAATEEPSGEVAGGDIDPCALVTKEEAEATLGVSVGEPTQDITPSFVACDYETSDLDSVGVSVFIFPDAGTAADSFQSDIDVNGYEEVDGVGDRAYRAQPIFDITFQKGKYEVNIDIVLGPDDEEFALAKDLAVKAAARLP